VISEKWIGDQTKTKDGKLKQTILNLRTNGVKSCEQASLRWGKKLELVTLPIEVGSLQN